jgi:hypothetical protein
MGPFKQEQLEEVKMKKIVIVAVSFLVLSVVNVNAQCTTTVSGPIVGETWTIEGSPYCVEGDIEVVDLVIEPGVIVEFLGDYAFNVSGRLRAVGTADALIEFLKADGIAGWQGISVQGANSELVYCIISGYSNGGLKIYNHSPVVSHLNLIGNKNELNTPVESGTGLFVTLSSSSSDPLVIENSSISNNIKYGNGAGIYAELSTSPMILRNCTINNNSSCYISSGNSLSGGGIFVNANGGLALENCEISGNNVKSLDYDAYAYGGGIYVNDGTVIFKNCAIISNLAQGSRNGAYGSRGYAYGGGIFASTGSINVTNCIVGSNSANGSTDGFGGGVYNSVGTIELINTTVASNNPNGVHTSSGSTQIKNSIIYFNTVSQVVGTSIVAYSDIQGGHDGEGNIDADPLFKDTLNFQVYCDYSPCTDAGWEYPWYNDSCFLPSCGGERNDMGAYGGPDACGWCAYGGDITLGPCEVPPVGDFDEDGDVDPVDLFIFSGNYGTE